MTNHVLTHDLSEPLNGATSAKVDINSDTGHVTIDGLARGEQLLASGSLQYFEKQGVPNRCVNTANGEATLTLKANTTGQPWFRFPWTACGGAYEWRVRINPTVPSNIRARTGGGNLKLDLAGMAITSVSADTGGGNVDVILPDDAANVSVTIRTGGGSVNVEIGASFTGSNTVCVSSGAGNVVVRVPAGIAARIQATSGLGKVIVDPRFSKTDKNSYQSPDYDGAASRIDITARTGAGNVRVEIK